MIAYLLPLFAKPDPYGINASLAQRKQYRLEHPEMVRPYRRRGA